MVLSESGKKVVPSVRVVVVSGGPPGGAQQEWCRWGWSGSFLEDLPRGGKIEIFGYEGGRGSIHGNMGLHAF